jgi:hypothetical protein
MALISYPIRRIGLLAQAELEISQSANLLGSTSRGLFVLAASGHVIFLSGEPFAGPWTANLHLAAGTLPLGWHELAAGKNAQIQARRLILPSARAYFDAAGAERWQPPEADPAAVELAGLEGRIQETARRLLAGGPRGFSALLEAHTVPLPEPLAQVSAAAIQLHASLRSRDLPAALQAGESLLGLGSGLTPSGDDLLAGLLLGLARWGTALHLPPPPGFFPALLESARQRTTALSASLLEAAAAGMVDERLLSAVDGLLSGQTSPSQAARALLAYGNSSGVDFFIGFSLCCA